MNFLAAAFGVRSPGQYEIVSQSLAAHLETQGLNLRGGISFRPDEPAPSGPSGAPARAVVLVGNAGAAYWPQFSAWRSRQPAGLAHPLDTWCREVIGAIAEQIGAKAVSPSDRPFLPFQQWATRAEGLKPSPLGILMHPDYGLWHAYRGALLFDTDLGLPTRCPDPPIHLCDTCMEKPCLGACPAGAYSVAGFDHAGCLAHVRGAAGQGCREGGCLDRNACPHGGGYRYPMEVQAFHMAALSRGAPRRSEG